MLRSPYPQVIASLTRLLHRIRGTAEFYDQGVSHGNDAERSTNILHTTPTGGVNVRDA